MITPENILSLLRFIKEKRSKKFPLNMALLYVHDSLSETIGTINLEHTPITDEANLPSNLRIDGSLTLYGLENLKSLPSNLYVRALLDIRGTSIYTIPSSLTVQTILVSAPDLDYFKKRYPNRHIIDRL